MSADIAVRDLVARSRSRCHPPGGCRDAVQPDQHAGATGRLCARHACVTLAVELADTGGEKRFLDGVVFGERGLGGLDVGDLDCELTREQAYDLLRLFGAQDYALKLDARSTPRPADSGTKLASWKGTTTSWRA